MAGAEPERRESPADRERELETAGRTERDVQLRRYSAGALMTTWPLYAGGTLLAAYLLVVLAFVVAGRRTDARALAGFVPDCVILFSRLLRDPRVPRRSKILVAALIPYLALPVDLIPDVIPVAGQADDAVLVALVLRILVKRTDAAVLRELWPGPDRSLLVVFRLAGVRVAAP